MPRMLALDTGPRIVLRGAPGGFLQYVSLEEAQSSFEGGSVFIDSREREDYLKGHIRGAVHISAHDPDETIEARLDQLPKDAHYVVYCDGAECGSSTSLARRMKDAGFSQVYVFYGGWDEWMVKDLPIEAGS